MKSIKVFLSLLLLVFGSVALAQEEEPEVETINFGAFMAKADENVDRLEKMSYLANISSKEDLLYLNSEWQNGMVLNDLGEYIPVTVRYEVLNQAMEVKVNNDIRILSFARVRLVRVGEQVFVPAKRQNIEGLKSDVYMEVFYGGAKKLVGYYRGELSGSLSDNSYSANINGTTKASYDLLFYTSEDLFKFDLLPGKKRLPSQVFPEAEAEVAAFIKENKLKQRREDLISVFSYYDGISKEKGQ